MKKILSILFSVLFAVLIPAFPVAAAEKLPPAENNAGISAQAKAIEERYGIGITYPIGSDGYAAITMNNLETLDLAFGTVTPSVVKQVSKYYQERNGRKIEINYIFSDSGYNYNGGVLMAAFEQSTSKIFVFLPAKAGRAIISGENPIALVHEFGHAFHLMCIEKNTMQKMRDEWLKFNRGNKYNPDLGFLNPDEDIFISGYASTSYEEDFAEVFAHTFVRSASGTGFKSRLSQDSKMTGLGQKVDYVEKLLASSLTNVQEALNNYHRIYKTASSTTFEGVKFSGEYLQYIGYPQPKNILKGILNELNLVSEKSTWVRSLGAWRVVDRNGSTFFIFPGGSWAEVKYGKLASWSLNSINKLELAFVNDAGGFF